jgi:hypothetical protein
MDNAARRLLLALADATPAFSPGSEPALSGPARRLLIALADAAPAFVRAPGTVSSARLPARPRRRASTGLRLLAGAGAAVVITLAASTVPLGVSAGPQGSGTSGDWWAVPAVVLGVLVLMTPLLVRGRGPAASPERVTVDAADEIREGLSHALIPIARQLGRVATAPTARERAVLRDSVIPMVLDTAVALLAAQRVRACWFRLTDDEPSRLEPDQYAGRAETPTVVFEPGTAEGDLMFGRQRIEQYLFTEETPFGLPLSWARSGFSGALIAVPVVVDGRAYGLLTVDSPAPRGLTRADVPLVELLAYLLGDAFAYAAPRPRGFRFGR